MTAVREISGGGVSVVYGSVGRTTFEHSLDTLLPRGLMVAFGNSSGIVPSRFADKELGARGSLQLAWCMLRDFFRPDLMPAATNALIGAMNRGEITIEIGAKHPLELR